MSLKDKTIVVTGGSRGLGLGLVEALVDQGARVTVVARDADALAVRQAARLGVAMIPADVTDESAAQRILAEVRPDILVLNAGATPRMGRLDQLSWADFTATWETDVKAGLYWLQAALNLPLKPGSRVLVGSSGAAVNGSPLSGGYAGAKRMLWIHGQIRQWRLRAEGPRHPLPGDRAAADHRRDRGRRRGRQRLRAAPWASKPEAFLARFGAPLPPREFGEHVVSRAGRSAICRGRRLRSQGRYRDHGPRGRGSLSASSPPASRQRRAKHSSWRSPKSCGRSFTATARG